MQGGRHKKMGDVYLRVVPVGGGGEGREEEEGRRGRGREEGREEEGRMLVIHTFPTQTPGVVAM